MEDPSASLSSSPTSSSSSLAALLPVSVCGRLVSPFPVCGCERNTDTDASIAILGTDLKESLAAGSASSFGCSSPTG